MKNLSKMFKTFVGGVFPLLIVFALVGNVAAQTCVPPAAGEEGRTGDLAERILTLAVSCTDAVDQYVQSEGDGELTPLVFSQTVEEFVILSLHLTDRTAFQAVGATRRSELMDQLSPEIQSLLGPGSVKRLSAKLVGSCTWEDKFQVSLLARAGLSTKKSAFFGKVRLESFFVFLPDDLNQRNAEYAGMKLFADTSEPLKGTLFWEFGGHVSEVVVVPGTPA